MNKRALLFCLMAMLTLYGTNFATASPDVPPMDQAYGVTPGEDPAAAYQYLLRQNQVTGTINPLHVQQAYQQVQAMRKSKKASNLGLTFTSLGPDNFGGRTRAVVIDRNNPSIIYAGASGGGVWKSLSNGSSWVPMTANGGATLNIKVSCMIQAPNGTLYAGTGEGWYNANGTLGKGGFMGTGIYKNSNGNDFVQVPGTTSWKFINELAYHQNRLWAATDLGLFYTNDEQTWTLAKDASGNELNGNATDIQIGSNGIIVAAVNNLCYVSETGSETGFVNQSLGGTGKLPASNVGRAEFAIAPSNPDIIYASMASQIGNVLGIFRSVDKGSTWTIIGPGASTAFGVFTAVSGITASNEGIINNTISVWPDDPDVVIVAGVDLWQGNKVANEGFFAWTKVSSYAFDPLSGLGALYVHKGINQITWHPNEPNGAYIATDGGVFRLTQGQGYAGRHKNYKTNHFYTIHAAADGSYMGGTADNGVMRVTGKGNSEEEGEIVFTGPGSHSLFSIIDPKVVIVSRTGGVVRRSIDYGDNFSNTFGTNINMNSVTGAFIAPMLLWESFFDYTSLDSVWYVADKNYPAGAHIQVRSHNGNYPFNTTTPLALSKGDSLQVQDPVVSRYFFGGVNGIWMTDNVLDFRGLPRYAKIADFVSTTQALAISHDGNVLLAGTQNGTLLRVSGISTYKDDTTHAIVFDTIATWPGRVITSIAISPRNANRVLVTLGNYGNAAYVYGSSNALDPSPAFTSWQGNLPPMPVYSSLIEMQDQDRLLVGTEYGLFSAIYSGSTPSWSIEDNGIPDIPVFQIWQQTNNKPTEYALEILGSDSMWVAYPGITNYGMIYFATQGRGVYRSATFVGIEDLPTLAKNNSSALTIFPNPATNMASLRFETTQAAQLGYQIFDLSGRVMKSVQLSLMPAGMHTVEVALTGLKEGAYILRLHENNQGFKAVKLIVR